MTQKRASNERAAQAARIGSILLAGILLLPLFASASPPRVSGLEGPEIARITNIRDGVAEQATKPTGTAPAPLASTYSANRAQDIVFVSGVDPTNSGSDQRHEWQKYIDAFRAWGWSGSLLPTSYYSCDTDYDLKLDDYGKYGYLAAGNHDFFQGAHTFQQNHQGETRPCNPTYAFWSGFVGGSQPEGLHDHETSIEHLAYHWAWAMWAQFGSKCFDVVAHSMGGLIVRYAIAWLGSEHFPPRELCVDDVVTLGTPHEGASIATVCYTLIRSSYQCSEMESGSPLMQQFDLIQDPQASGGTDWTLIGSTGAGIGGFQSTGDGAVSAESATGMSAAHRLVYEEPIFHSELLAKANFPFNPQAPLFWKNAASDQIDQKIDLLADPSHSFDATIAQGPWPARFADMSLAYKEWGCGTGADDSAWPLAKDLPLVGEPYTKSFNCWYYIDVPAGQARLEVAMASLNGKDMNLYVHPVSSANPPLCSRGGPGSSESCLIASPSAGRWFIEVQNQEQTRDPFTVSATFSPAVDDLDSTSLTSHPDSLLPGQPFSVCWKVEGQGTVFGTRLLWGTSESYLDQATPSQSGNAPMEEVCDTLTAPQSGSVFVQSQASGPNDPDLRSGIHELRVQGAQDDCGKNQDAGDSQGTALNVGLPLDCQGTLLATDTMDWYKFFVAAGSRITASMTPPTGSSFGLCLYTPSGSSVRCGGGGSGLQSLEYTTASAGEWALRVSLGQGGGTYTLSARGAPPQNDCGTGTDAGRDFDTAAPIPITSVPGSCQGALLPSQDDDRDWYKVSVRNGDTLHVSMTPQGSWDFDLYLYNPHWTLQRQSVNGGSATDSIEFPVDETGDWRIAILRYSGEGGYTLTVSATASQNDCSTGGDAGNDQWTATRMQSDCSGKLPPGDPMDWYKLYVDSGILVTATLTPNDGANFDLCFNTPSGATIACSSNPGNGSPDTVTYRTTSAGDWLLDMYPQSGTGSYTLSVSLSS